jgi:hypothetical protein
VGNENEETFRNKTGAQRTEEEGYGFRGRTKVERTNYGSQIFGL